MKIGANCFVLLGVIVLYVQAQDYCNPELCDCEEHHIGCDNKGVFGPQCPAGAQVDDLPQQMQALILQIINLQRNLIASGWMFGFSPAKAMPVVQWDPELASLALLNSKNCVVQHDSCRNTDRFHQSGQTIGITWSWTKTPNLFAHLISIINSWFYEFKNARMSDIKSYKNKALTIANYATLVNDRISRIGCATVSFPKYNGYNVLTNCNFDSTNIQNSPVYIDGPTASGCLTGRSTKYRNLCSENENVDPNRP